VPTDRREYALDLAVPVVLACTVFALACGSSSVTQLAQAGRPLRWVALFVLLALAAACAYVRGGLRLALPTSVLVAAAAFALLALVSTLWSVDQRLTAGRAVSIAVLLAAAAALGQVAALDARAAERILLGVLAGAAAVALAGLLVLAFDHAAAVESATPDLPARYQGLGENPDTAALLLAVCFPLVAGLLFRLRGRRALVLVAALALLLDGSVVASGSRGSLIAGFVGVLVVVATARVSMRARALAGVGAAVLLAVSIVIALAPKSKGYTAQQLAAQKAEAAASAAKHAGSKPPRYVNVEGPLPLDSDIGTLLAGTGQATRTFFGLSGRGVAWRGALDQADERPVLGYGFGTENHVFVDRYALFVSGLVEDSYIGIDLQLGAVGLVALLALAGTLLAAAARSRLPREAAAPAGVLVVGLALGFVQSYLYSAGNIGTLTVWTCGFVGAAALARRRAAA
jgi:O-antigen ligase